MMTYESRERLASKEQGIDDIVSALALKGITATSEQTGGFCMCAYVVLKNSQHILANLYGASAYSDDEGYEHDIIQFNEPQKAEVIAQAIANYIKGDNN